MKVDELDLGLSRHQDAARASLARLGRPFVTLSFAQSLDGALGGGEGRRLFLSGAASLRMTHRLRVRHDAIVVGIGTALADDPQLTARGVEGKSPQRVVLDTALRLPATARLFEPHAAGAPWIVCGEGADLERERRLEARGAAVLRVRAGAGGVCLETTLRALFQRGVRSVMVEGGATVLKSFLEARLVDYLVVTIAPVLTGGARHALDVGESFARIVRGGQRVLDGDVVLYGAPDWQPLSEISPELACPLVERKSG